MTIPPAKPIDPIVVGIGASAGGLSAFKSFFTNMPADTGMAFVLVQHLSPEHKSMLVELLQSQTTMPIVEAKDGTSLPRTASTSSRRTRRSRSRRALCVS